MAGIDTSKIVNKSGGDLELEVTSASPGEDLIIEQLGANDSSITITAAGTGTDAIKIDATAGDMQIAPTLADGKTLKIGKASAVEMVLSPHGTAASEKFSLTNTAGTAVDAIDLQSVAGGIKIDAGLDANAAAIHLDSASGVTIAGGDNNDSVYIENSALELEQISAPTSTTNKLYNVGGTLTWNGGALTTGGVSASSANVFTAKQSIDLATSNITPAADGSHLHIEGGVTQTDNNTSGSGTAAQYSQVSIEAITLAATNSSVTTTNAATLFVSGPPAPGANQTITNAHAIWAKGPVTVGVDDTGHDVKFYGATSGQYMLWDESADELVLAGDSKLSFHDAAGGENIIASSDGHLEVNAGTTLDMTAPTVDVNAATAVTMTTPSFIIDSATAEKPLVEIKNTTNDADGAILRFVKDKGSAGAADDFNGRIQFFGDDAAQDQVKFSEITSQVKVHTNGQEGGKLSLGVATHDGEMQFGLVLEDGDAEDEIDATIGNGTASVTTIAGTLDLGDRNITNVGDIDADSISIADAASGLNIDGSSANTGTFKISLRDNMADALNITEGGNSYMKFVTTNGQEGILVPDNRAIFFGDAGDNSISHNGTHMVLAGDADSDILIGDNTKLYFGDGADGHIVYDEAGNDSLQISGGATGGIEFLSDTAIFTSANATDPLVTIKNTTNDADGPRLRFEKDRVDQNGADGDDCGIIEFYGTDASSNQDEFARITVEVLEADHGSEAGKMTIQVAENDGTLATGIMMRGSATVDGKVDVDLGAGTGLVTIPAGGVIVGGDIRGASKCAHTMVLQQTGITDNVASGFITVTVPNAANAACLKIRGIVYEVDGSKTHAVEALIAISRSSGDATAVTIPSVSETNTGGGFAAAPTFSQGSVTGAASATQSFNIQVTANTDGSNYSYSLECTLINGNASGISMVAV